MSKQYWRLTYLPVMSRGGVREVVFEGTKAEMDAYFLARHVCGACKEEMKGGEVEYTVFHKDGSETREVEQTEPYSNPWLTPCACEWDIEEDVR